MKTKTSIEMSTGMVTENIYIVIPNIILNLRN